MYVMTAMNVERPRQIYLSGASNFEAIARLSCATDGATNATVSMTKSEVLDPLQNTAN
jgi:hypothetical protein